MESKAKLLGHSVHQMLVVFPVGLLATAVVFDLIWLGTRNPVMAEVSFWMMAAGIVGGLLAAPFGLVDWLAIAKNTRAKRIGAIHGGGNLVVVLLFVSSWWLRSSNQPPSKTAVALSIVGGLIAVFTAWLGGELVSRLGVGVYEGASLDAPSSLGEHHHAEHRVTH